MEKAAEAKFWDRYIQLARQEACLTTRGAHSR
jgi:hypothetical protein